MENLHTSRIVLAGAGPQANCSLMTLALALEMKRRGLALSMALIAPNLSFATMLRRVIGRNVRICDERLLAPGQILVSTYQACVGAELLLIDGGAVGLYDGIQPGALRGSPAEYAAALHTPVILVVDPGGFGASLAALYRGYQLAAQGFQVSGLLLNNFAPDSILNEEGYDEALRALGQQATLGILPQIHCQLPNMPLSQSRTCEALSRQFLMDVGSLVSKHVDVDAIVEAATHATAIRITEYSHAPLSRRTRIAVADDGCFSLLFQDNLELLRYYGAEIVPFSPLADDHLPGHIGGLYIPGCFLEEYAAALADNQSMRESIAQFADSGGVVYSEGAGSAYLCRQFKTSSGQVFDGVGLCSGLAISAVSQFGYVEAVSVEESVLGRVGLIIKGIKTADWRLTNEERDVKALRFTGVGPTAQHEGHSPSAQVLSSFHFLHFGSNPEIAKNIVDACEVVCRA